MKIEQMEFIIGEMKAAKNEHPKATIYYDWSDREIRITYPLPNDLKQWQTTHPKL